MELGFGLYALLAIAIAVLATREFGRSAFGWFLLALLFTPLVGLLLFVLPPRRRPCPYCAEPIQPSAVVCRFCGRDVHGVSGAPALPPATRIVLLILVLAVLAAALGRCQSRFYWWSPEDVPVEVLAGLSAVPSVHCADVDVQCGGQWCASMSLGSSSRS